MKVRAFTSSAVITPVSPLVGASLRQTPTMAPMMPYLPSRSGSVTYWMPETARKSPWSARMYPSPSTSCRNRYSPDSHAGR